MSAWPYVCDKFLHNNMLRTHTSKPQSDSTLHPECSTSAKGHFPLCFKSIFLVCNMLHSCQKKLNSFCHICSEVVLKSQKNPLSKLMRRAYELYSGCKIRDQDMVWVLRICCRLVETNTQNNIFCCSDVVAWASRPLKWLLFLHDQDHRFLLIFQG